MTLRLPLSGNKHATIVSAYAPTMMNPDEVKEKFYDDIDNIIPATPRTDKLIHKTWEGVIGLEGVGKRKSNGLLLLRKCAEHDLLITNTVFKLPNRNNIILDASPIQTLASHRLCHNAENRLTGC